MLPKFPEFKRLQLSDRPDVEYITSQYDPYSDFDFVSMWSWDVNDNTLISQLNGNLVAILSDHFTDRPFYSFLGNKDVNNTLKQLFTFSARSKNSPAELRLVPEISLKGINLRNYLIEIDLNNCDYIYNLQEQTTYSGSKYSNKRKLLNKFIRSYSDHTAEILDLNNESTKSEILRLSEHWSNKKTIENEELNLTKELLAIRRFLNSNFTESLGVGVKVNNRLIGYELFTLLENQHAISHFSKINTTYSGAYEFLANKYAIILLEKGINFLNAEEDLGLPGLRFSKNSFRPTSFLRKYTIKKL